MQFRDHPGVQGKRDAYPFDPRLLKVEIGYNVRSLDAPDERAELDELKESIRANGVRTPLEVRLIDEDVFITAGHRRHKAVMELIAEGEPIKAIPVIPEPKTTTAEDRIINLVVSNSGKPLKPLEVAEVVRRLVAFGWEKQLIAKRLGKSASAVSGYLDMIAMPEPVKEQVRENAISATEAAKAVKSLPKGTDPIEAARMIAANREENKRLGIGAKNGHKVTAKTLKRDRPAATKQRESDNEGTGGSDSNRIPDSTDDGHPCPADVVAVDAPAKGPSFAELRTQIDNITNGSTSAPLHGDGGTGGAAPQPTQTFAPPPRSYDANQKFFAIIARLATIGEALDLNELADDHVIEVPAEVIKAADRAYREHIGDV